MNGKITLSNKLKGAVTMANTIINGGASPYPKGASGDIITITDGAENTPLKSAVVNIEPVQDLHGYSYPWPAGGGKNLLNNVMFSGSGTLNDITWSKNSDGSITLGGTASALTYIYLNSLPEKQKLGSGALSLVCSAQASYNPNINGLNFQNDIYADGTYVGTIQKNYVTRTVSGTTIELGVSRLAIESGTVIPSGTKFYPQIEQGKTPTAFAPYSNICPISGWTQVNAWQSGVNLLCPTLLEVFNHSAYVGTPNYRTQGTIPVKPNTTYTLSFVPVTGSPDSRIYEFDASNNRTQVFGSFGENPVATFTTSATAKTISFYYKVGVAIASAAEAKPMLQLGSTATPYEPYVGDTYPIPLGQTVYGGTLDVVSGKLNVKPYYASYSGQTLVGPWISSHDKYVAGETPTTGAQVVDMGAAGTDYDVTPQTIKTLLGVNNIWADSGDTTLEYYPAAASIVAVQNRSTKVYTSIPLGMIRYETYQITPQQTIDLDSYRSQNGNLLRSPVATKCKLEFNTPLMTDTQWAGIWNIIKAGFNNNTERKLKLKYYDTLSASYKTGYFYVPDVQTTIRNIDEGAGVINYNEIRIAFIEY